MAAESTSQDFVDELYLIIALKEEGEEEEEEEEEIFIVSDEKYAEALQLQEALMSSTISLKPHHHNLDDDDDRGKQQQQQQQQQSTGTNPASPTLCLICMDTKPAVDFFRGSNNCAHVFCTKCMIQYIAEKMQRNDSEIKCPDKNCAVVLEAQFCRPLVPKQVFDRWASVLCAAVVSGAEKAYCPFEDCSAAMVAEGGADGVVTMAECPSCHRLFCAQCKVAWHGGTSCEEFQRLNLLKRKREDEVGAAACKKEVKEEIP